MNNRQSADKSFAYILGTYMSDGCVTKEYNKNVLRLEVMDEDFANAFYHALESYGVNHLKRYKIDNPRYRQGFSFFVVSRDNDLCELLVSDTNHKKLIPDYVYKWDKELKLEFISAFMDGEGYVSKRTKIMRNGLPSFSLGIEMEHVVLEQFKKILQSVGVKVGKFTHRKQRTNLLLSTISLNINSWFESGCYFYILRKQDKVLDYIHNTNLNDYTLEMS